MNTVLKQEDEQKIIDLDEIFMRRCLELASIAGGSAAPNPMVGAVLVHDGRIIGEGYHQRNGEAHAEVNCIASVKGADRQWLSAATMYVSLEPCAHHGKTPPCADLLIKHKIPKVVIGCRDPFVEVDGKGMEELEAAGIKVVLGILEYECRELNKRFLTFHEQKRPYIILKWAETADGFMAGHDEGGKRLLISNEFTNRLVHRWRSEEMGILVGTETALLDDPQLTNRYWEGPSPVRMVIDTKLRLPATLQLFDQSQKTIVLTHQDKEQRNNLQYLRLPNEKSLLQEILEACYQQNITSLFVEGGAKLLYSFLAARLWDEARVITNKGLLVGEGLRAPALSSAVQIREEQLGTDKIVYYKSSSIPLNLA